MLLNLPNLMEAIYTIWQYGHLFHFWNSISTVSSWFFKLGISTFFLRLLHVSIAVAYPWKVGIAPRFWAQFCLPLCVSVSQCGLSCSNLPHLLIFNWLFNYPGINPVCVRWRPSMYDSNPGKPHPRISLVSKNMPQLRCQLIKISDIIPYSQQSGPVFAD